jgi:hypothetical protein
MRRRALPELTIALKATSFTKTLASRFNKALSEAD